MAKKAHSIIEVYELYASFLKESPTTLLNGADAQFLGLDLSLTTEHLIQLGNQLRSTIHFFNLTKYGIRNAEVITGFLEKSVELIKELFAHPVNLKPIIEWSDVEKGFLFGITVNRLAAQTHDIKLVDRLAARMNDVKDRIHKDKVYLGVLIALSTTALLLITIMIATLFVVPVIAIPLAGLLALTLYGLSKFITLPDTHSKALTLDQEITEFCQELSKKADIQLKSMKQDPELMAQLQPLITTQVTHGRFKLPASFFKVSPVPEETPEQAKHKEEGQVQNLL